MVAVYGHNHLAITLAQQLLPVTRRDRHAPLAVQSQAGEAAEHFACLVLAFAYLASV